MILHRSFCVALILINVTVYSVDEVSASRAKAALVTRVRNMTFEKGGDLLRDVYPNTVARIREHESAWTNESIKEFGKELFSNIRNVTEQEELQDAVFMMCSLTSELRYHVLEQLGIRNTALQNTFLYQVPIKETLLRYAECTHEPLQQFERSFSLESRLALSTGQLYLTRDLILNKDHANNECKYTHLDEAFRENDQVARQCTLITPAQAKLVELLPKQFVDGDTRQLLSALKVCERISLAQCAIRLPNALFCGPGIRSKNSVMFHAGLGAVIIVADMLCAVSYFFPTSDLSKVMTYYMSKIGCLYPSILYSATQLDYTVSNDKQRNEVYVGKKVIQPCANNWKYLALTFLMDPVVFRLVCRAQILSSLAVLGLQMGFDYVTSTIKYDVTPISIKELWEHKNKVKPVQNRWCTLL